MKNRFNIPVIIDLEYYYKSNTIDHFDCKNLNTFQYARISTNGNIMGIYLKKITRYEK